MDTLLEGMNYDKVLFIISDKYKEIGDRVIHGLNRGGTLFKGEGMYNGNEKNVIFTVVNRREVTMLQEFIHRVDPQAFVTVLNANEILGEGFKSLEAKLED